tara:strand:+ start:766 stop:2085 length:1320 start_codon:yes stop_codon:yes gene_type:complete
MQDIIVRKEEVATEAKEANDLDVAKATAYNPTSTKLLGIGLALMLATAAFLSGLHIGGGKQTEEPMQAGLWTLLFGDTRADQEADIKEFWRVWNLMEDKFVSHSTSSNVSVEDRLFGAISGMVDSYGDPYTVFLPPQEAAVFGEDISGNFSGVGMEVGIRDGYVTVIAPLADTPAERAGLLAGDIITEIDGVSTEGMSTDEAVLYIRGEVGSTVTFTVYREGATEFIYIPVVRDVISIPTIKTWQQGDTYIIELYSFNALAESKMQTALEGFKKSGADNLIIDLRNNPGGYLDSAVAIASYFLPAGKVIVRENYGDEKEERIYRSHKSSLYGQLPDEVVILVDGGSASASEILAGALREHKVATLIGSQTFGKGSVQELIDLPSGSSLKVTVARWLTPEGVSISDGGLTPDIVVDLTTEEILAGNDKQLQAAFDFFKTN